VARDETPVIIKKGQLISGHIDKASIGEENGALIRSLYANYNENIGIEILNRMFKLGIEVLLRKGFTTAISDTDLPERTRNKIESLKLEAENEVDKLISDFKSGKLDATPGFSELDTLEAEIVKVLNRVRNAIGNEVLGIADENNPTIVMSSSGAKGNILNLAQMAACVGQQALRGRRIKKGYLDRTLSIFNTGDLSPKSHGFIRNGFKSGLNPYEFFFGAMTGRDSLMDVALRTPKSGYLYRRLSNALQDIRVEYDNTVRDANKTIIQFIYGEDGVDVSKSEGGKINVKKIVKEITNK